MLEIMLMNLENMPLLTCTKIILHNLTVLLEYRLNRLAVIALLGIVTVLLEYIDRLLYLPKNLAYYAGIMLDAFRYLLCSKLCRHNWRKPTVRF